MNIYNLIGRISEYYRLIFLPFLLGMFALYLRQYTNIAMLYISIGFFVTVILVTFILTIDFLNKLSDGTRDLVVSIAQLVYSISLTSFLYLIIFLYSSIKNDSINNIDSFWFIASVLITATNLYVIIKYYRWLFSKENVPSNETPSSSAIHKLGVSIAVISDLHINITGSYETKTPLQKVCCELRDELELVKDKADFILFLGDITDTGRREEWLGFRWAIEKCDAKKVLIIPGNHDITFCTNYISRSKRVKNFIDYVIAPYYGDKRSLDCNIQTVSEICNSYKSRTFPRWEKCLDDLYPMILQEENDIIIIGLNSSTFHGFDMISNGMGKISETSLRRLKLLKRSEYKNKVLFLVLHNHVCFKPGKYDEIVCGMYGRPHEITKDWSYFKKLKNRFQTKGLKMINSKQVMESIIDLSDNFNNIYVLHGHLHREYQVNIGKVTFISAPSFIQEKGDIRKQRISMIEF